jgi:hypothetical protein
MKLYSYCIPTDDGAAPNPFWDICTLTICKPVIRRTANVGDWIVGVGSKNVQGKDYSGRMVYAMKITEVMSLAEYDEFCREVLPKKIPDIDSRSYRRKVGDCQYDYSNGTRAIQREGVHLPKNRAKDLRGKNALLSNHFYYFGNNAKKLPAKFSVLVRQGQGHQKDKNDEIKDEFVKWLEKNFRRNKLYGKPQIKLHFRRDEQSNLCATERCEQSKKDEAFYKKYPKC